mgnify:FL=1
MQKDVKPHIVLIDGVKYYSDKPETCRSCFFWKNRKAEKVSFWEVYQVLNQLKY